MVQSRFIQSPPQVKTSLCCTSKRSLRRTPKTFADNLQGRNLTMMHASSCQSTHCLDCMLSACSADCPCWQGNCFVDTAAGTLWWVGYCRAIKAHHARAHGLGSSCSCPTPYALPPARQSPECARPRRWAWHHQTDCSALEHACQLRSHLSTCCRTVRTASLHDLTCINVTSLPADNAQQYQHYLKNQCFLFTSACHADRQAFASKNSHTQHTG